jgi:2-(1,2-epoxy-1,2-dihydrophenyl)acetyl-CoA isomerase
MTGAGRGFCAGQDLNDRAVAPGQAVDLGESVERRYNPLIRTLTSLPMPVIARVNGVAADAWPCRHQVHHSLDRPADA